eukprot:TRINITY_DN406_c0_g1_i1.p1 TRINITY_DN406_c0_g1~~TRINITY_DN406_c0_g1_i1.p1  ORF type:complete len:193 (-),score=44.44 TRINITY_DN406_c0_g1_i1:101-652(-)
MQLTYLKGDPINFDELVKEGKTVFVIEFWATWCPPCRNSIPHLSELQQKYKSQNVVFIGVTSEDPNTAKKFADSMGSKMDYLVAHDSQGDASRLYMQKYGVKGIPHAFILSRSGQDVWHGHPMDPNFEPSLKKAIADLDPSQSEEALSQYPVSQLKAFLQSKGVDYSNCVEKSELVALIKSKF